MTSLIDRLVEFRIITDEDSQFLKTLYASTRADEMAQTHMTLQEQDTFLTGQFKAQTLAYEQSYIGAVHRIIQLNKTDIGRLIVQRADKHMRIIDLSILPNHQGRGVGTDILKSLLNEAHGGKVPVYLMALKNNPALSLYLKLGFKIFEDKGVRYHFKWTPTTFKEI